jgi:HD-GYP domain-containing protein (c-di-GMP phosphodiesterase class II)
MDECGGTKLVGERKIALDAASTVRHDDLEESFHSSERGEALPCMDRLSQSPTSSIRLAEVMAALSRATDLAMGQPLEFALCSCVLAIRLGDVLGYEEQVLREIYYQALLRYIGCNADTQTFASFVGDELAFRADYAGTDTADRAAVLRIVFRHIRAANTGESPIHIAREIVRGLTALPGFIPDFFAGHCEVAERLATRLGFEASIVGALGQLYERWDGKGLPKGLKGEEIAPSVRIVTLAQDAVIHHRLGGVAAAVEVAKERRGTAYDPEMVDRFCERAANLWAGLDENPSWDTVLDLEPGPRTVLDEDTLDEACRAIADFADLKSPYTLAHSHGVADLAAGASREGPLSVDEQTLRRAGLLHDVGRVAVSASIWSKPGPLNEREWEQVRMHPYHAERIFSRPPVLARYAAIASYHHERLDGSGYYRHVGADSLSPAARLLAAADVYQALTEPRPHRAAFTTDNAAEELLREAKANRLDRSCVDAVLAAAGHRVHRAGRQYVSGLTEREVEVLRLVARGLTKNQVAAELFISPKTADNHVQHIYEKIGVSTRAGAALFAVEHNLLS